MVPAGWYPHEDRVQPTFDVAHQLKLPALFRRGVFIDGRSSRFCRPSYFEALRAHPGMRVTLAHLGWPWSDEAIAIGLIDLINGVPADQVAFRFDLSFGPPPAYRKEVLGRALSVLGSSVLQFGSDCFLPCSGKELLERRGWLEDLLAELEMGNPNANASSTRQRAPGWGDPPPPRFGSRGPVKALNTRGPPMRRALQTQGPSLPCSFAQVGAPCVVRPRKFQTCPNCPWKKSR